MDFRSQHTLRYTALSDLRLHIDLIIAVLRAYYCIFPCMFIILFFLKNRVEYNKQHKDVIFKVKSCKMLQHTPKDIFVNRRYTKLICVKKSSLRIIQDYRLDLQHQNTCSYFKTVDGASMLSGVRKSNGSKYRTAWIKSAVTYGAYLAPRFLNIYKK